MMYHTVSKKVNYSTVVSQERTPANPPAIPGLLVGQTCWRAWWTLPVLRTCLIVTTRYGRSRNQALSNMTVPVVGAEELQNLSALWISHDSQTSSRSMFYCGISLYLVATGHEDTQDVANCGPSSSLERWFHLLRWDNNPLPLHLVHLQCVL